jgi:hypothetical protein
MAKSYRRTPKRRSRAGWPARGYFSKAMWRYHFATDHSRGKAKARRIARATPGGRKVRYRQLPERRPGRHVKVNSARTGFVVKAPRYGKGK